MKIELYFYYTFMNLQRLRCSVKRCYKLFSKNRNYVKIINNEKSFYVYIRENLYNLFANILNKEQL